MLSMETEYYAFIETAKKEVWLKQLLIELGYDKLDFHPTWIFGDNLLFYTLCANPKYH
jgi:hypothetical protein